MVTVPVNPYDQPLSELQQAIESIGPWIAVWEARTEPDAFARRCAADAVSAVDAALRNLYLIRGRLTHEVRQADDATARRADELLGHYTNERTSS